ncbi:sulfurtransferase [Nocardioides houyundeii]|uniref:sulfurtransferase n=1 Tax=Nocardioides houyundeii TaxID=2045452 RepID=UPI000C784DEE|nr:sulfurtransferase [Nocardioides houyundeii]
MTGPLISAEELAGLLGEVTLLDVRYEMGAQGGPPRHADFVAGHLPGARYVDLDTDLAAPPGEEGRHPLPEPDDFQAAMRRLGVTASRPVVVYDDWQGRAAARAWWLLRYHGHTDVRVLDGGLTAWREAGGELERGLPARVDVPAADSDPDAFVVDPSSQHLPVVRAQDVASVRVLVDARAAARYRGEVEPVDPVAGHIPGAVNLPTERNRDDSGRFRTPEELARLYAGVGAVPGVWVAAYCGSGVTATHDVLAMELAGIPAALFPGGWSGWITDPARPVE